MLIRNFPLFKFLFICSNFLAINNALEVIKIGVLIKHRGLEVPLNKSLEILNDRSILTNHPLKALVEVIETDNSYLASAAVCRLLEQKVWAIIAPQSIQLASIIQSITSYYHIPVVFINWLPYSYYSQNNSLTMNNYDRQVTNDQSEKKISPTLDYTINLYPQADKLSRSFLDLIKHKNWRSFSLIYDSSEDFVMVKDIFEMSFQQTRISIQKISLPVEYPEDPRENLVTDEIEHCILNQTFSSNKSYEKLLKDLRKRGAENIVLSMPLKKVCQVLHDASRNELLTVYNDYIIANLDVHLLNLTQFHPITTNISGFTLLDPSGFHTELNRSRTWLGKRPIEGHKRLLSTEYSMMSDAISLLAYTLEDLINGTFDSKRPKFITGPQTENGCESTNAWEHGEEFMSLLKSTSRQGGYSGDIKFDAFGQRTDFELNYIIQRNNTFKKVASWNMKDGLDVEHKNLDDFGMEALKNRTLIVTVALTTPYVQLREGIQGQRDWNDRYEGYCIDLMNKLANKLGFKYVIREVEDKQYGKIQNGSWTGMVRELLDWKADLAIVDLTITKERQSAVDFTHPFMTLGVAIMYKKPKLEEAEMYSFLMPFSKEVWLSMWSAYVGISLAIWLISRLSPLEWKNPHPCVDITDEKEKENEIHSIGAGLWFTIGSLMQQGSDLAPRSPSVRALASVWYFFTLILISSYTANFAAFLTASRMQSPIESAEDLSKQTKISYGCKNGGATQAFFATSNHSTYRRMWNFMESKKSEVFLTDNSMGISRVKKGNFAFLMESTSLEYEVQRDCELTQIGGLLDHKGYGIALRKRSPFRAPLSKSIVELNEAGELENLKNKWWNPKHSACVEEKEVMATSELGIDKVGGVFVMLGVGVAIACVAAILEFVWKSLKVSRDERKSISSLLMNEIMRILKCGPSKRPAPNTSYYNKSNTSHPSSSVNLNASANSLNKGPTYVTRKPIDNQLFGANNNQNGYMAHNQAIYGDTPVFYDNRTGQQMSNNNMEIEMQHMNHDGRRTYV